MSLEYFPCYHSYRKKCEKLTDQELGRLFRALMLFSETGEQQELAGRESIAFDFIAEDITRAKEAYEVKCQKNAENAAKRHQQSYANASERYQLQADDSETCQNKTKTKEKNKEKEIAIAISESTPARAAKMKYGVYGWVKLTQEEYNKLLSDLGETELIRCITYIDESAQKSGNKNKWKDWNLVIRNCHRDGWGMTKSYTNPNRIYGGTQTGGPTKEDYERMQKLLKEFGGDQDNDE